jgi:hypothetical protein
LNYVTRFKNSRIFEYQINNTAMTTAAQIRRIVKANYSKHFAVVKMKHQGLDTNYCLSNAYADDFTFLIQLLAVAGIKSECVGVKNSLIVYGN